MSDSIYNDIGKGLVGLAEGIKVFANALNKAQEWYQNHADTIASYLLAFAEFGVWSVSVDKLVQNQFVFTDDLTATLAQKIYQATDTDIDGLMSQYYFGNDETNMNRLIARCQEAPQTHAYQDLYFQVISAYRLGYYQLACIGLFSLIDGVLADVSDRIKDTRFKHRLSIAEKKFEDKLELNEIDRKTLCIHSALQAFDASIFCNSDFSKEEPASVNRHWDVHGRTRREHTKIDFLKVLLWLDAIIYISESHTEQGKEEKHEQL